MTDWESTRRMVCGHRAYLKGDLHQCISWRQEDCVACSAVEYVTLAEMEYRLSALRAEYITAEAKREGAGE